MQNSAKSRCHVIGCRSCGYGSAVPIFAAVALPFPDFFRETLTPNNRYAMPRKKKIEAELSAIPAPAADMFEPVSEAGVPDTVEDDLPEGPSPSSADAPIVVAPSILTEKNRSRYLSDPSYRQTVDKMIPSFPNFGKQWTDEESLLCQMYYDGASDKELEAKFGRTIRAIYLELLKMRKLEISPSY